MTKNKEKGTQNSPNNLKTLTTVMRWPKILWEWCLSGTYWCNFLVLIGLSVCIALLYYSCACAWGWYSCWATLVGDLDLPIRQHPALVSPQILSTVWWITWFAFFSGSNISVVWNIKNQGLRDYSTPTRDFRPDPYILYPLDQNGLMKRRYCRECGVTIKSEWGWG